MCHINQFDETIIFFLSNSNNHEINDVFHSVDCTQTSEIEFFAGLCVFVYVLEQINQFSTTHAYAVKLYFMVNIYRNVK